VAALPYWRGYFKLSLVSFPVALYSAKSGSERTAFRQINKKTGNRLRQQSMMSRASQLKATTRARIRICEEHMSHDR
jgi:DNA end-binding protein Ku